MGEGVTKVSERELKDVIKALGKDEWAIEQAEILLRIKVQEMQIELLALILGLVVLVPICCAYYIYRLYLKLGGKR